MDFNLEELKDKYRKKTRIDMVDLVQLQTLVPMLIREVCRLEDELEKINQYIRHLEKKKPPCETKGKINKAEWLCRYDMKEHRMLIQLKGVFDAKGAKKASNAIIATINNATKGFDLINDIRELETITDMRTVFHLKKTRYHLVLAGINRTVRVVGKKENVASTLFEKYFKEGPNTMVVHTLEDAEKALDNQGKFLSS